MYRLLGEFEHLVFVTLITLWSYRVICICSVATKMFLYKKIYMINRYKLLCVIHHTIPAPRHTLPD
jgi:hypothetical protein